MSEFKTVVDFGTQKLRLGVFNNSSNNILFSKTNNYEFSQNNNFGISLNSLIRSAEKYLSKHIDYVNVLYDSSNFNFINLSIKKSFDQPSFVKKHYDSLIQEANFIIKENYFRDKVIHLIVKNIIIDENKNIEILKDDIKTKSLILEIKFICLSKSIINNISNRFKKNNLNISNIFCSSYVKTFFYKKYLENKNNFIFLDIGFNRTSAWFFCNKKLEYVSSVSLGGNNITKDISKVLKLNIDYSEQLKINFNKESQNQSLDKNHSHKINLFDENLEKNISIDLFKEITQARINEIIELTLNQNNYLQKISPLEKPTVIFIGGGSKLLSNFYSLNSKKIFSELIFFKEDDSMICEAGFHYNRTNESQLIRPKNKSKKIGFFERFFNLFSK